MTAKDIHFWFDFISPYGYLASLRIDELAARHGRNVAWHPLLLGVSVLKVMGLKPLMDTPLKGDYAVREIDRYCRRHGVQLARDLRAPPMNPLPAGRALVWLLHHAPQHAKPFARAALQSYWQRGVDVDQPPVLLACAAAAGVPAQVAHDACTRSEAAALLRSEVESALAQGIFGSPFVIVDGEPFFGVDKLELIDDWLQSGGW